MQKLVAGVLFATVNGLFLWLLVGRQAISEPGYVVAAAAAINVILGIRIGYLSAHAYAQDVVRLNRYLCDQNEELVNSNREMLLQIDPSANLPDSLGEATETSGASTGS